MWESICSPGVCCNYQEITQKMWKVLKKYQNAENEAKNDYARWFCAVKSDMTYGSFELGDTYVSDIKAYGVKVK